MDPVCSRPDAERRIEEWRRRLIDLTRRNRLVYFRPSKTSTLDVICPDAETVLTRLVTQGKSWRVWMPPLIGSLFDDEDETDTQVVPDERPPKVPTRQDEIVFEGGGRKDLERVLRNLYRRSRTDYQERGVRILHVAVGMLTWTELDSGEDVCSPLILCPVALERDTSLDAYFLTPTEEDAVLNPALAFKLNRDFRIQLPPVPDWEESSLQNYLDAIADKVQARKWAVEPKAVLGLFSFHKLVMYQDLQANEGRVKVHPVVQSLVGGHPHDGLQGDIPHEKDLDSLQEPEEVFQILDADSSQQQCILAALRGRSLVLQGPPGTGKSQTIANIIGEFIARGKSVLFVSEKMAALEVVYKRLCDRNLGHFCLELHSDKANKRDVIAELERSLNEYPSPKRLPSGSDFERLRLLREQLNRYVLALHEVREPLGKSVFEVLGQLASLEDAPSLSLRMDDHGVLTPARTQRAEELVQRLVPVWGVVEEGAAFPWRGCRETTYAFGVRERWTAKLTGLGKSIQTIVKVAPQLSGALELDAPSDLSHVGRLIEIGKHVVSTPQPPAHWLAGADLDAYPRSASTHAALQKGFREARSRLLSRYHGGFLRLPGDLSQRLGDCWRACERFTASHDPLGIRYLEFAEKTLAFAHDALRGLDPLTGYLQFPSEDANPQRLAALGESLLKTPSCPAHWLSGADLDSYRQLAERHALLQASYRRNRAHLLSRYHESVFELSMGLGQSARQNWDATQAFIAADDRLGRRFLAFCEATAAAANDCVRDTDALAHRLQLQRSDCNFQQARGLAKLGVLCDPEVRPPREWLDPIRLRDVQNITLQVRLQYEEYRKQRDQILQRYDESLLSLDLDRLVGAFSGPFRRSPLRWVSPGFYQDRRMILKTARSHVLSPRVLEDLTKARDINWLRRRLDESRPRVQALLAECDNGYDTDFDAVVRAAGAALEVIREFGGCRVPPGVTEAVSVGTPPMPELRSIGQRMLRTISEWESTAQRLVGIHPSACLPGMEQPFETIPFQKLIGWALAVADPLRALQGVCEQLLPHCRNGDALHIADLVSDLEMLDQIRAIQAQVASQAHELGAAFGALYRGLDTDWQAVLSALEWTQGVARLLGVRLHLVSTSTIPAAGADGLPAGTIPVSDLRSTGQRILDAVTTWGRDAQRLVSAGLLGSVSGIPGPLSGASLSALAEWGRVTATALRELQMLRQRVVSHCRDEVPAYVPELLSDLDALAELRAAQDQVAAEEGHLRDAFGTLYRGLDTDWDGVARALRWTHELRCLLDGEPVSENMVALAAQAAPDLPLLAQCDAAYQDACRWLQEIEEGFEPPGPVFEGEPLRILPLDALAKATNALLERVDDLQAWVDLQERRQQIAQSGLAELNSFLAQAEDCPPLASSLVRAFQKALSQSWVNAVFQEDPALGEFRGQHHEQLIDSFRRIDRQLVGMAAERVIERCNARRPASTFLTTADNEVSVLRREAAKKRRHLPIRHLFERIPNLLLRIKPCLLMSPLSVSQFVPPDRLEFDLVIFDEASQIFTEDAVCAIYRGRQLIVAGDSKQLPPTDFFKSLDDGDEPDDETADELSSADFTSVLDECGTVLPLVPNPCLKWHYRSRHEALIAFSNHQFYGDRLITFPSARSSDRTLGVSFVHVPDGVYDRGGKRDNRPEAEVVADLVFEHFRSYPRKSLGVIAFSQAQMVAIEEEIERRRREDPGFERFFDGDRLEGFFVKNLENVQGDERDVIVFSVGYGKDRRGQMTMGFGPLNRDGGERRLNVAVTRAREKVILVSSIRSSDLRVDESTRAGVLNLSHYLDYAERGYSALEMLNPVGSGESESPLEEKVAHEIRAMGYEVAHQVGCSGYRIDLGVIDPAKPGRFLLGVECDGATYHSAATARDRDRLRQQVLESLSWRIHRVWSPDWTARKGIEVRRLRQAIQDAQRQDPILANYEADSPEASTPPSAEERKGASGVMTTARGNEAGLPGTVPYKPCSLELTEWVDPEFHLPEYRSLQCNMLFEVVEQEGPIHIELAARRLLSAWGLMRTGSRIKAAMEEAASLCEQQGVLVRRGDFLWRTDPKELPVRVPAEDEPDSLRSIDHIPPEEIQAAMLLITDHAVGLSVDSLLVEAARLFGFRRAGGSIRERLRSELDTLSTEGAVLINADWIALTANFALATLPYSSERG
ncbi:MAG: DUF3320 domain-containing protein [Armatimonadetes bacterium]|nr:DUF3320 domain-containing protein [Armatimonadota bacterium]